MELRPAKAAEAAVCYQCIEDAKAYQRAVGFAQWHPGYPTLEIVKADIADGVGYVLTENGEILGYCCMIIGMEPAYGQIDGAWQTDRPYTVVHRVAFSDRARSKGLSKTFFALVREFCRAHDIHAIRIDTHADNVVMRHVLDREGFVYCGIIQYDGPRRAYEWDEATEA